MRLACLVTAKTVCLTKDDDDDVEGMPAMLCGLTRLGELSMVE